MRERLAIGALALCSILTAAPARADETEAALLGALAGNILGSKTELEADAGEIENTMINSRLLLSAAMHVETKLKNDSGLLLVGDEDLNLGLPDDLDTLMQWHVDQLTGCQALPLKPKPAKNGFLEIGSASVGGALAEAIKGAPAPKTTITGYQLTVPDSALVAAVQAVAPDKWSRIGDVSLIDRAKNSISLKWTMLRQLRAAADNNACASTDSGKARIEAFDAFNEEITALGEKGAPSLLLQAERMVQARQAGQLILRLRVEIAGGSVINADNLLTRLGMPAVSLTGGTVVSYRLVDPGTGKTSKADLLVCYAPKRYLKEIHKGRLPAAKAENCLDRNSQTASSKQ